MQNMPKTHTHTRTCLNSETVDGSQGIVKGHAQNSLLKKKNALISQTTSKPQTKQTDTKRNKTQKNLINTKQNKAARNKNNHHERKQSHMQQNESTQNKIRSRETN